MGYSLSALLKHGRQAAVRPQWKFEVDRSGAPASVAWRWERCSEDGKQERSSDVFLTFAECARDAQAHGFTMTEPYTLTDKVRVPSSAWAGSRRATADDDSVER
ncbi:MAG: hypothetical protein ACM3RQ_01105 [Methanocella sp.]